MKKFDYNDYVYLRIPKSKWKEFEDKLKPYRIDYKWKIENKSKSANRAARIKQAKANLKMFNVLNNYYSGLFKNDNDLTPYKLAKEAGVSYMTARRFWEKFNIEDWIENFKRNTGSIDKFLYNNLAEDLVILNIKNKKQLKSL